MHICCIEGSYLENWGLQWIQLIHEDLFQRHNLQQQLNIIWLSSANSKSNLCLNLKQYSSNETKKKKNIETNKQANKIPLEISIENNVSEDCRYIDKTNFKVILLPTILSRSYHQQLSEQFIGICVSI